MIFIDFCTKSQKQNGCMDSIAKLKNRKSNYGKLGPSVLKNTITK